jgi:transposase
VADSAFHSQANIQALSDDARWLTRVPATLTDVQHLLETTEQVDMTEAEPEGYWILEQAADWWGWLALAGGAV